MENDIMKPINIKKLAHAANVMNTISGGMSVAHKNLAQTEAGYHLTIDMAGADEHSLKVEIQNQSLFIYQVLTQFGAEENRKVPVVIEWMPIPTEVDFKNIQASFEGRVLKVFLPFNELASGYRKRIDIIY